MSSLEEPGTVHNVLFLAARRFVKYWGILLPFMGLCVAFAQGSVARAQSASAAPLVFPLRALHVSGNWGTNELVVADWNEDPSNPLVPTDYIELLEHLSVNWIGLSVALTYDDSMDSTIERNTEHVPPSDDASFSDDAVRRMIREFRAKGLDVYLTLAFEAFEAESAERPVSRWQLGDPGGPDGGSLL